MEQEIATHYRKPHNSHNLVNLPIPFPVALIFSLFHDSNLQYYGYLIFDQFYRILLIQPSITIFFPYYTIPYTKINK